MTKDKGPGAVVSVSSRIDQALQPRGIGHSASCGLNRHCSIRGEGEKGVRTRAGAVMCFDVPILPPDRMGFGYRADGSWVCFAGGMRERRRRWRICSFRGGKIIVVVEYFEFFREIGKKKLNLSSMMLYFFFLFFLAGLVITPIDKS